MKFNKNPNFLIVGAAKSGTTSIFNYLREHPQIYLPDRKECGFFSEIFYKNFKGPGVSYIKKDPIFTFEDYMKKCFNSGNIKESAIGESSTDYLYYYQTSIRNIKRHLNKEPKIIIILRNPIEAVISRYKHNIRRGWETLPLEDAIYMEPDRIKNNWLWDFHYIKSFSYSEQIKTYLSNFDNVLILLYDDLKNNPIKIVQKILKFIEVDDSFKPNTSIKYNTGGIPKYKKLYEFLNNENTLKNVLKKILPKNMVKIVREKKTLLENFLLEEINMDEARLKEFLYPYLKNEINILEDILEVDLSNWRFEK